MKLYSDKISLIQNSRGIYCLDTSIGCSSGISNEAGGCYNDCYAAKSAKIYGYDFSTTVLRKFKSEKHKREIISQIDKVKLDFIRIGCSGDPSENWQHCIDVIKVIQKSNKEIVIITKHWGILTDEQLQYLSTVNVCINTSVSALDKPELLTKSLQQFNRIKPYCKSILRIVSCDFNQDNEIGKQLSIIQDSLFSNIGTIDTIFRPSKKNPLVIGGIINSKVGVFNGSKQLMSKFNRKTYSGKCGNCKEMCGQNMNVNETHLNKRKLTTQGKLFK